MIDVDNRQAGVDPLGPTRQEFQNPGRVGQIFWFSNNSLAAHYNRIAA